MPAPSQLSSLKETLSSNADILTNPSDAIFQECLQRWSDIDKQTPSAIVLPTSEEDIQKTVQWALQTSTPFVTKSGGHSEWSTIGSHGIIIDLGRYSAIDVDAVSHTAALRGSVLQKEVAVHLAEAGVFTALGNGNTVGAIPYFLNGGVPVSVSITGFGSDQIVSARLITAKGDLIEVTEETYPDLLWAIRGAGQFFGLITQLMVKTYPLSLLGNDRGVIWMGSFVFPTDRAEEVCSAMKVVMDDERYGTSGLMMVTAPPPTRKPTLIISARLTGDPKDAGKAYKSLYDLKPLVANGGEVPIQNTSDARAAIGAKGDFKQFGIAGLPGFDVASFLKTIELYKEMVAECPDATNTAFNFQWDSRSVRPPDFDSAMGHHHVRFWQNNLIWHTDAENRSKVDEYNNRTIAVMRTGQDEADWVDYQNSTRVGPLHHRYRGTERLARLKELKKAWDPEGVFTTQLLG